MYSGIGWKDSLLEKRRVLWYLVLDTKSNNMWKLVALCSPCGGMGMNGE